MNESRPQPVLFRFHVKPAPAPPGNAAIPSTSVRRHTLSQSDSPCISNAQHSVRPDQSRCIYQVLPRQQDVFHPTGHDLLNGRPLPGTENRHQVGPHVLRHMPYLSEKGEAITSQPAAWNHVFCVSETSADVSRNTAVGRFTIGFT